jgi:hypothetical protein
MHQAFIYVSQIIIYLPWKQFVATSTNSPRPVNSDTVQYSTVPAGSRAGHHGLDANHRCEAPALVRVLYAHHRQVHADVKTVQILTETECRKFLRRLCLSLHGTTPAMDCFVSFSI